MFAFIDSLRFITFITMRLVTTPMKFVLCTLKTEKGLQISCFLIRTHTLDMFVSRLRQFSYTEDPVAQRIHLLQGLFLRFSVLYKFRSHHDLSVWVFVSSELLNDVLGSRIIDAHLLSCLFDRQTHRDNFLNESLSFPELDLVITPSMELIGLRCTLSVVWRAKI